MAAGGVTKTTKVKKVKKMAMGGSAIKPFAAGIPYAAGSGQTDSKNGIMKKGGMVKNAKLAALAAPKVDLLLSHLLLVFLMLLAQVKRIVRMVE